MIAVGDHHARHFVAHERRVAVAGQRPDPGHDGDAAVAPLGPGTAAGPRGRRPAGVMANSAPASTFCRKRSSSRRRSRAVGSSAHADHGEGLRVDGLAAQVDAAVQPPLHGRHADRIGVEHARGVRIIAQLGRIAGHEQEVANLAGRTGQQVGLHADQVAVAAAEMEDRLDLGLLLDPIGRRPAARAANWPGGRREC